MKTARIPYAPLHLFKIVIPRIISTPIYNGNTPKKDCFVSVSIYLKQLIEEIFHTYLWHAGYRSSHVVMFCGLGYVRVCLLFSVALFESIQPFLFILSVFQYLENFPISNG